MAKKATPAKPGAKRSAAKSKAKPARSKATAKPERAAASARRASSDGDGTTVDALLKLLESPLVADLLAVGATAALAAITESRYSRRAGAYGGTKAALKAAAVAAAAAIGRRLSNEFSEIREASKRSKGSATA